MARRTGTIAVVCASHMPGDISQERDPTLVPLPKLKKPLLDLLDILPWPVGLRTKYGYEVFSEDTAQVSFMVAIGPNGDAWISVGEMYQSYRFRSSFGSETNLAVRNALVVMAEAIRRHNEK